MGAKEQHDILKGRGGGSDFVSQVRQVLLGELNQVVINDSNAEPPAVPATGLSEQSINRSNFAAKVFDNPDGMAYKVAATILPLLNPTTSGDTWTDAQILTQIRAQIEVITNPIRKPDGTPEDMTVRT